MMHLRRAPGPPPGPPPGPVLLPARSQAITLEELTELEEHIDQLDEELRHLRGGARERDSNDSNGSGGPSCRGSPGFSPPRGQPPPRGDGDEDRARALLSGSRADPTHDRPPGPPPPPSLAASHSQPGSIGQLFSAELGGAPRAVPGDPPGGGQPRNPSPTSAPRGPSPTSSNDASAKLPLRPSLTTAGSRPGSKKLLNVSIVDHPAPALADEDVAT